MKRFGFTFIMIACLIGLDSSWAAAGTVTRGEAEETARLIGMLFSAARVVIERNQPLINDPTKGDKGFTAAAFERELVDEFRARTNIDLEHADSVPLPPNASELLRGLVNAGKAVVADAQPVINQRGIGYKNFIPASFGSGAASRFSKQSQCEAETNDVASSKSRECAGRLRRSRPATTHDLAEPVRDDSRGRGRGPSPGADADLLP